MMAMARGYDRETSEPNQTRLLGRSQVRQLERKEEMKPIGHCALRPTDDLNGRLAGYKRHLGLLPLGGTDTAFASIRTARRSQEGDLLEPDLCGSEYFQAYPSTGRDLGSIAMDHRAVRPARSRAALERSSLPFSNE